jgi:hypothetical protein
LIENEFKKYNNIGIVEDWKIGRLEDWKIGRLEDWKIGRLVPFSYDTK